MNTKTKKTIAKEIIYFFTIVALLLLVWAGIEIRNSFLRNKINNFSKEISDLTIQIDSIEKTYPKKAIKFSELIQDSSKPKFDPQKPWEIDWINVSNIQVFSLYDYLVKSDFDFIIPGKSSSQSVKAKDFTPPSDGFGVFIPTYELFESEIINEFDAEKQPYIVKIYNFIKSKNKKFTCNMLNFVSCLKELPPIAPLEIMNKLEEMKRNKTEINQKSEETENKLIDRNETEIIIVWFSSLLFGLLYPFRFIFFLLSWAFKTVKLKD